MTIQTPNRVIENSMTKLVLTVLLEFFTLILVFIVLLFLFTDGIK